MSACRIMYIDDDEDDLELFRHVVTEINEKIHCYTISDPSAALEKLISKEWNPDLIFLDLNMPKISGEEFFDMARKQDNLRNIPIIFLSTSSEPNTVRNMRYKGATAFVTKPNKYEAFVTLLAPFLDRCP